MRIRTEDIRKLLTKYFVKDYEEDLENRTFIQGTRFTLKQNQRKIEKVLEELEIEKKPEPLTDLNIGDIFFCLNEQKDKLRASADSLRKKKYKQGEDDR